MRARSMPPPRKPLSLKTRALQALALREHSRSELRGKLLRRAGRQATGPAPGAQALGPGPNADEVDALLDALQAQGLLSPERFIESRVHARSARFGNRRIQAELAQHGLQLDTQTAEILRASELERARAVWFRRYGMRPPEAPLEAADVARQMRFLAARGFSPEVIRRVVKGGPHED